MPGKKYVSIISKGGDTIYIKDAEAQQNKADKVSNATSGNLVALDSNGNITDSGVTSTFATIAQATAAANELT